jgi:hypothetical protein
MFVVPKFLFIVFQPMKFAHSRGKQSGHASQPTQEPSEQNQNEVSKSNHTRTSEQNKNEVSANIND